MLGENLAKKNSGNNHFLYKNIRFKRGDSRWTLAQQYSHKIRTHKVGTQEFLKLGIFLIFPYGTKKILKMPIGKHNYRRFQKCITWPCSVTSFLPNGQNVGHQLDLNFRIVKREKPARTSCERTLTTTTRSPLELIIAELKVYSPFCCVTMNKYFNSYLFLTDLLS